MLCEASHNAGQMELYLRWLEVNEQESSEDSPLGLILCAEGGQKASPYFDSIKLVSGSVNISQNCRLRKFWNASCMNPSHSPEPCWKVGPVSRIQISRRPKRGRGNRANSEQPAYGGLSSSDPASKIGTTRCGNKLSEGIR